MLTNACFSIRVCKFAIEYFLSPVDPGYNSNISFLNWSQSSVPTASCICHNSLSSFGAYLTAHSMVCFADKPQDSPNCSTSSKTGDKEPGLLLNLGAE